MSKANLYHIITVKEIKDILNVGDRVALKIKDDLKETYRVVFPLRVHFYTYFNIECKTEQN